MIKIVSANLNGIRAATKKGFLQWLAKSNADFVCLQEIKAQANDLGEEFQKPGNYQGYFHFAQKKGYSGTGIYTRHQPDEIVTGVLAAIRI